MGDCVANKKLQAEVAKKYGILKSRIQRTMSGKKEHKKGGNQYQEEKKRRASEEGSVPEKKGSEPEIAEVKTAQTPEPEKTEEEREPSSVTVMSYQTCSCSATTSNQTFGPFQDHPNPPIGNIPEKALKKFKKNKINDINCKI